MTFLLSNWFSRKHVEEKKTVSLDAWREIARTTLMNRDAFGFHKDGAAEEMAAAGYNVISGGGTMGEAIDAVSAAYDRNFIYSTPHEHPCDEWKWSDVMKAAA